MKEKKNCEGNGFSTTVVLVFSGSLLGLLSLFFSTGQYGRHLFSFYLSNGLTLLLNLMPFVFLNFFFFFITNRVWAAFALDSVLCLLFSWSNFWKLLARDAPLVASDLLIVSEALDMSANYISITPLMIGSLFLALILTLLFARYFHGNIKKTKTRVFFSIILIMVCCILFFTVYTSYSLFNLQPCWPQLTEWFTTTAHISRGGIYPFIYSIPQAFPTPPSGYREDEAVATLHSYKLDEIPKDLQASVIFVMLEAFTDLSEVTDNITSNDPYTLYHDLQNESYHGNLIVNVFAGGTNNTEQCVITGYPYLEAFAIPSWSYARYFASQGYTVNGAHAGYQGFYNRNIVNSNLGFPEYRFIDNYYRNLPEGILNSWDILDKDTAYYLDNLYEDKIPMDFQFLPEVTDYCKAQIELGQPVFSFNVTYQNHGPYPTNIALFPREYIPRGNMSESDYNIANNYLAGIEETAKRMSEMVDEFRDYEEPVVVVFFGDHKPWLGDQNTTYHALGIDIASNTDSSFLNYYSTEYLIWANDAAKDNLNKSFVGTGPTISPAFLMNVLFEQCGWGGPEYKKLSDEVMCTVPVVHETGVYASDDKMVTGDDLTAEQKSLLHKLNCVRYYLINEYMMQ